MWRNNYGVICINYIVHLIRQEGHKALPYVTKYKDIRPITTDVSRHQINIHNERLYDIAKPAEEIFNYNTYKNHDTIVLQSCTGTGKTHAVLTEHTKHYMQEHPEVKLMTLTNKRNLSDQHCESFQNLSDYRQLDGFDTNSFTICLNSISKKIIPNLTNEELQDYVVYIDEIDSFLIYTQRSTDT